MRPREAPYRDLSPLTHFASLPALFSTNICLPFFPASPRGSPYFSSCTMSLAAPVHAYYIYTHAIHARVQRALVKQKLVVAPCAGPARGPKYTLVFPPRVYFLYPAPLQNTSAPVINAGIVVPHLPAYFGVRLPSPRTPGGAGPPACFPTISVARGNGLRTGRAH